MVNTRTDADLSAAVQNALRLCFPRFAQKFARSSVPVLDRRMLWKSPTAPVDAENWISHMEKIFDDMGSAGTEEEQAKNFQWGLRRSTHNHLMCMSYTDVAQVANAARNYEILHERDDDDKSGDRHQPTTQQSSHRNHGHNNDRHRSDRRGGGDNHRSNNNYSGNNNIETGVISPTDLPILVPSSLGVPLRATPTQFALRMDADT
nr:hypothetical protein [Tanacetum cinerariifolium]